MDRLRAAIKSYLAVEFEERKTRGGQTKLLTPDMAEELVRETSTIAIAEHPWSALTSLYPRLTSPGHDDGSASWRILSVEALAIALRATEELPFPRNLSWHEDIAIQTAGLLGFPEKVETRKWGVVYRHLERRLEEAGYGPMARGAGRIAAWHLGTVRRLVSNLSDTNRRMGVPAAEFECILAALMTLHIVRVTLAQNDTGPERIDENSLAFFMTKGYIFQRLIRSLGVLGIPCSTSDKPEAVSSTSELNHLCDRLIRDLESAIESCSSELTTIQRAFDPDFLRRLSVADATYTEFGL